MYLSALPKTNGQRSQQSHALHTKAKPFSGTSRNTWQDSLKSAYEQSIVIITKTGQKATDYQYTQRLVQNMGRAHERLVHQVDHKGAVGIGISDW